MPRINGLTPRDFKFLQVIIRQIKTTGKIHLTNAGLEAFNTDNPKSAGVLAAKALENVSLQEQIRQAFTANGLTLDTISANVGNLANTKPEKVNADTVLRANVELLKLMNAYPSQKKTSVSLSMKADLNRMKFQEVKTELEKIDGELKAIIDGEIVEPPKK